MAGRKMLAHNTLALVVATTLGCVNLDKNRPPGAYAGGQVTARGATGSNVKQGASALAASASQKVKSGSQAITSKLKNVLPKSKSVSGYRETLAKDDPTRLDHDPGPLGADLYVAAARLAEKNGQFDQAVQHYRKALQADRRNRNAMIGLARLQHRKGDMQGSIRTYRDALNIHRNDPVILNDLGLCYARNGQLDQAINVLRTATQVAPNREMYRNNLAAALVEANRAGEAVAHLTQTYGAAVANYNVGYLLNRSGRKNEAAQFLARALQIDPTLQQARTMLDRALPQVSSLPQTRPGGTRQYSTGTTPQRAYQPLPPSTPHSTNPPGRAAASPPPHLPEHLRNNPPRQGPFGYLPANQGAKTTLVSYDQEQTNVKERTGESPATVVTLRRPRSRGARGRKIEPPEPTR